METISVKLNGVRCKYWNSKTGCNRGSFCNFLHNEVLNSTKQQYRYVQTCQTASSEEEYVIYFSNLPKHYTKGCINRMLVDCGKISKLKLLPSKKEDGSQSGFVHMSSEAEAWEVITVFENTIHNGVKTYANLQDKYGRALYDKPCTPSSFVSNNIYKRSSVDIEWDSTVAELAFPSVNDANGSNECSQAVENWDDLCAFADAFSMFEETNVDSSSVSKQSTTTWNFESTYMRIFGETNVVDSLSPIVSKPDSFGDRIANDGCGNGAFFALAQFLRNDSDNNYLLARELRHQLVIFYALHRKSHAFCGMNWEEMILSECKDCYDYASYLGLVAQDDCAIGIVDLHALSVIHTLNIIVYMDSVAVSEHGQNESARMRLDYKEEHYTLLR